LKGPLTHEIPIELLSWLIWASSKQQPNELTSKFTEKPGGIPLALPEQKQK
jgi:hypothetical protein